ncbi:MAG: hypothetical protein IKF91_01960 [Bacilli bacterium]|nr:hypothetical protein [Bacilli bacterium]
MKIKTERDKRTYLIIALCAILVVMGAGYAAFSSLLTINGTANISNSWCVGFDNTMTNTMEVTKGVSTGTQPTGSMSYSGTACGTNLVPNSSLVAHFYQPGDQIEYTLTITNKSTVTAAIKSILVDNESVTQNTTKKKGNITYVVEMPAKTTLAVNESTTMKIIAKFRNETDVTGNVNGETKTIEVKINAEQDDGNGGMDITPVSNKFTGTLYRWNTTSAQNGGSIVAVSGTKWVETDGNIDGDYFNTESECQADIDNNGYAQYGVYCEQKTGTFGGVGDYTTDASTLGKTYYLKHDVVDDIITASYVCFVYNNAEHCMKGADGGASFAANTQIIKDFQTFNNLPDNANPGCVFSSSLSDCIGGGFNDVYANSNDLVGVGGSSSEHCDVANNGYSRCYQ